MYRVVLCPERSGGRHSRGGAGEPYGPPGENWGGYAAASRSPSRGAGVAARAATPPGGVDRDNSSSRAIASASASTSRAATWPPIARYVQCLNMKYKLSLVLIRAAARARKETVYHYTTEPQTCVLAS